MQRTCIWCNPEIWCHEYVTNGKHLNQAVSLGLEIAKEITLPTWESDSTPTYDMWIKELVNELHLGRLRFSQMNRNQVGLIVKHIKNRVLSGTVLWLYSLLLCVWILIIISFLRSHIGLLKFDIYIQLCMHASLLILRELNPIPTIKEKGRVSPIVMASSLQGRHTETNRHT